MDDKKSSNDDTNQDAYLLNAFNTFDADGSGDISRDELKRLMTQLGQNLTKNELDAMINKVNADGDREISFEEFKTMLVASNNKSGTEQDTDTKQASSAGAKTTEGSTSNFPDIPVTQNLDTADEDEQLSKVRQSNKTSSEIYNA